MLVLHPGTVNELKPAEMAKKTTAQPTWQPL